MPEITHRILVIGSEVSDFLCAMYKKMQEQYPFEINLIEPRKEWRNQDLIDVSFKKHFKVNFNLKTLTKSQILKSLLYKKFWVNLFNGYNVRESIRNTYLAIQLNPIIQKHDVICFHNLTTSILQLMDFIPDSKKIILSFWGSDLFRNNSSYKYSLQKNAIDKAAYVITHSEEMKVIALSKFGWKYEYKFSAILSTDFSEALKKYHLKNKVEHINSFKKKYAINQEDTIVVIGHSAHDIDNHIEIISAISLMDASGLKKCFFVLPMTYGAENGYLESVKSKCREVGIKHIILDRFLQEDEIIELRFASEILIRMSKFDAFSLSLVETLAAGNTVISASWLPYGGLRAAGIYYKEASEFKSLSEILSDVLHQKENYREKCLENFNKIIDFYANQKSIEKLAKLYAS